MAENTLPLFADAGKFYVYIYRDPRPRKKLAPIYVGKGTAANGRADVHWREGSRNPLLRNILSKLRKLNMAPIIELVAWYDDEDAAFECEIALINKFGRRDLGKGSLCNMSDGGEGPSGLRQSPEHIARLAEMSRGRERPKEERERISLALLGHPVSRATREKIAAAHRGRSLSEEHKEKLRKAQIKVMADPSRREAASINAKGRKHTPEACAKIGDAHRGKTISDEVREKLREANLGKKASPESRAKQSASLSRYLATEEGRRQRSESSKAMWAARKSATALLGQS